MNVITAQDRVELIKDMIKFDHYEQLKLIFHGREMFVVSQTFDFVSYCFEKKIRPEIIKVLSQMNNFKIRFPKHTTIWCLSSSVTYIHFED